MTLLPAWWFAEMRGLLLDLPVDLVIALSRTSLAAFGLIAIYIDPSQPAHHPLFTNFLLLAYLLYSLLMTGMSLYRPLGSFGQISTHLFDIAIFGILIHSTEGPTSPFFVLLTFALLSATLRWNWRGAVFTAGILVALLGLLSFAELYIDAHHDLEPSRLIMRSTYFVVAGVLLGYVGAYRERSRSRFIKIAAWPPEHVSAGAIPPLERSLAHAADVASVDRILAIWEELDEPFVYSAISADQSYEVTREPPGTFGDLVAPALESLTFMSRHAQDEAPRLANGQPLSIGAPSINPDLAQRFRIERVITAPLTSLNFRGRVFLLDCVRLSEDTAMLAKIIASRIEIELEHHRLRKELESAAVLRERARLARDVHDGTLQGLTAAAFRLRALAKQHPGQISEQLEEIRAGLADQQPQLRALVRNAFNAGSDDSEEIGLKGTCDRILVSASRQWGCEASLEISPEDATVTRSLGEQVSYLLAEAVANAARHGAATHVSVAIRRTPAALQLRIHDDGRGFKELSGTFDHATLIARKLGPGSIRERVAALGGQLVLSSSPRGVVLEMELPVA